jgi:hypothetical protein
MADLLADGNIKVTWAPSIANIDAPTVAELTAGSAVDLECLITLDGLDIKGDTASVDNTALCSTDDTEEPGRVSYQIEITAKRKDSDAEDKAWNTLTDRALGNLVVRRTLPSTTAWAADQPCEVYPGRCGRPIMDAPEKNSAQTFKVKIFNNSKASDRSVVAA